LASEIHTKGRDRWHQRAANSFTAANTSLYVPQRHRLPDR
jgi:hypothetical protein